MQKTEKKEVYAIVANKSYGLYVGIVESFDAKNGIAVVRECRHVAQWFGRTGGITSLAVYGLCGPQAHDSRIGAPTKAMLTGIVNVFECSAVARTSFESASQT